MKDRYYIHESRRDDEGGGFSLAWLVAGGLALWLGRRWRRRRRTAAEIDEGILRRGHQPEDEVSARGVAAFGAALLVMILFIFGAVALLINAFESVREPRPASPFVDSPVRSEKHPLQADPSVELRDVREREERLLHSYEWVDSSRGMARVPIGVAMDLLASRADTAGASDTARAVSAGTVRLLTESGYVLERLGPGPPTSPAYEVGAPGTFAVSPEIARRLGIFKTTDEKPPPE